MLDETKTTEPPLQNAQLTADELRSLYHNKSSRRLYSRLTRAANYQLRLGQWQATHQPHQRPPLIEVDGELVWLNRATRRSKR